METIASFTVDHLTLQKGIYLSRVDGDVNTYDIRTRRPNADAVMDTGTAHTAEHLFATLARNHALGGQVIYFGPMGCRTGFYLLTRGLEHGQVLSLIRDCFTEISRWEGEIPGATPRECGNYSDQNLEGARGEAADMLRVIENIDKNRAQLLSY